jgi:hypothetical protein
VVSGGLACVVGVFVVMAAFPALAAYDGRREPAAVHGVAFAGEDA